MASGGDDWDTVTYLRKKAPSSGALKTDKVIRMMIFDEDGEPAFPDYCHVMS